MIVSEFLADNQNQLDIGGWRTFSVYEMEQEAKERVAMTAAALEAIGAPKAAMTVRSAKSQSPFDAIQNLDFETPGQIEEAMANIREAITGWLAAEESRARSALRPGQELREVALG